MPKCSLAWYKNQSNDLLKEMKRYKQRELGDCINESQQTICYRLQKIYPKVLPDLIRILDLMGYEIKRKEVSYK